MSATVTITFPTELQQRIAAKASASGKKFEDYILFIAQKDAELPLLRDLFAEVRADIQARGITDEELNQDIDEAIANISSTSSMTPLNLNGFVNAMAAGTASTPVLPPSANERVGGMLRR